MTTHFEAEIKSVIERVHLDAREQTKRDLHALFQQGIRSIDDLVALLRDESANIDSRVTICWLLSRLNHEGSVQPLLELIDNENAALCRAAIQALGEINVPRNYAVTPIVKHLYDDDVEVRKMATYALGQIGDAAAMPDLIDVLSNGNALPEVRGMAAEALAMIKAKDAIVPLIAALSDRSPEVRFWSAFALGQLRAKEAISELKRLVAEDHYEISGYHSVSQEAAEAIKAING